jgi:hypothetical protein
MDYRNLYAVSWTDALIALLVLLGIFLMAFVALKVRRRRGRP